MAVLDLRLSDVRALLQLVGEIHELGAEPLRWRQHLLTRVARLCGAQVGIVDEVLHEPGSPLAPRWRKLSAAHQDSHSHQAQLPNAPARVDVVQMVDEGFQDEKQRAVFYSFTLAADYSEDPSAPALVKGAFSVGTFTRQDVVSDHVWYRSKHVNEHRRAVNLDHFLYSSQRVPAYGGMNLIGLHRPFGDKPFSDREVAIVQLLHEELGRQWARIPSLPQRLSPRLRDVLSQMLAGKREKEIAEALRLRQSTVHDYIKTLYRIHRVNSRLELYALYARAERSRFRRPALISDSLLGVSPAQ